MRSIVGRRVRVLSARGVSFAMGQAGQPSSAPSSPISSCRGLIRLVFRPSAALPKPAVAPSFRPVQPPLETARSGRPQGAARKDAVVAQLVRAPVCGTGGRWFEPTQLYQLNQSDTEARCRHRDRYGSEFHDVLLPLGSPRSIAAADASRHAGAVELLRFRFF